MPTKKNPHVLEDAEQLDAVLKRMKRAQGQVAAVVRMLEEGRNEKLRGKECAVEQHVVSARSQHGPGVANTLRLPSKV